MPIILPVLILWTAGLSIIYWILLSHYKRLTKDLKTGNLIKILDGILKIQKGNVNELKRLDEEIKGIKLDALGYVQKIGLVRFNPFNETGGDQSFSLSLLDKKDDGFVITCLHTRDRTRVYAKPIAKGKSEYELSREEEKALKKAK